MSEAGLVSSAACAAAESGPSPAASARSTPPARAGTEPMFTRATRPPCTATPTIAQSMARLVNFWNDQPRSAGLGIRISVSSSPGSSAVSNSPRKKSVMAISRLPDGPRVTRDQRSADGAPVPHLRVTDGPGGPGEQRQFGGQQPGVLQVVVAGQRPDGDVPVLVADVGKLGKTADVDEHLGDREPQLHQREQGMPARQELPVVARLGGEVEGLLDGPGPLVGERRGDHASPPAGSAAPAGALPPGCWPPWAAASTARTMLW